MYVLSVVCTQRKCEVYWPEKVGGTFNAGAGIHVYYKELIPFADYEIKIFSVTHVSCTLPTIQHSAGC